MQINLQTICPVPMQSSVADSQVWNTPVQINHGERIQINAPSGRGKTSLVHFLAGIRNDYLGIIRFDEQDAAQLKLTQWCAIRRERISMVFQDLRLFPDLTVMDNLLLKTALTKTNDETDAQRKLDQLGLVGFEQRLTKTLSQGEQQRVAIARALLQPCDCLVLDEPFSHLDPENIEAACQSINEFCELRNSGLVLTSLGYDYPLKFDRKLRL